MFITQGQLLEAIYEYIDTDIMKHANKMSSLEQFLFGFKVGAFKRSLPEKLSSCLDSSEFKFLNATTDDGSIDVDSIYEPALQSMQKVGNVTFGDLRFDENDLKKLYELIKQRSSK